jgi:hypothetical protein
MCLEGVKPYQPDNRMDYRQRYAKAGKYHMRHKHRLPIQSHRYPKSAGNQHQRYKRHAQQEHDALLVFFGYRFCMFCVLSSPV